ncbi:MAG: PhnD/SsuA/transferrin family substrate-binding protein, partial [Planctomycetota bacterium]|nr:PhnD/SsuA/transferrin family substrate-binding protein [Planctomycetota bacterium]
MPAHERMVYMRWIVLCGLAVAVVLAFTHRLVASRPVDATIALGSQAPATPEHHPSATARLHIGIAHITSPVPAFRNHQALAEKLAAAVNAEAELLQPDSYKGINALLRKGKIDVAFVCSGTYAAEPDAMDILAAPVVNGKTEYYGLIIVPANSPVQKFADLRGKSFLFVEEESNTGQWYP